MAEVVLAYDNDPFSIGRAKELQARLVAGGHEVHHFEEEREPVAHYVVVLWTKSSVDSESLRVIAEAALTAGNLIQVELEAGAREHLQPPLSNASLGGFGSTGGPIDRGELASAVAHTVIRDIMFALAGERYHSERWDEPEEVADRPSQSSPLGLIAQPTHRLATSSEPSRPVRDKATRERIDQSYVAHSSLMGSGAGTLTQFNAIVVALIGGLMTQPVSDPLRIVLAVALATHIMAAFVLCYALRPHPNEADGVALLRDTVRYYGRGWYLTFVALIVSALCLCWFAAEQRFGAVQTWPWLRNILGN